MKAQNIHVRLFLIGAFTRRVVHRATLPIASMWWGKRRVTAGLPYPHYEIGKQFGKYYMSMTPKTGGLSFRTEEPSQENWENPFYIRSLKAAWCQTES